MVRLADAVNKSSLTTGIPEAHSKSKRNDDTKKVMPSHLKVTSEQIYEALNQYMENVGEQIEMDNTFDIQKGVKLIKFLISRPAKILMEMHQLTLLAFEKEESYARHGVHVATNSLIVGRELGYGKKQLIELGVAALFHELGMYTLPEGVRNKHGEFTSVEKEIMKGHCETLRNILLGYGEKYKDIAEIVFQEHERIDGSGYPRGLMGDEIREAASIIGVVDIYDAMVNSRSYRKGLMPTDAMREIVRRCKSLFPTLVIKKFLKILSVFPVKSYVKLNNNAIGMVVRINTLWPLKPEIKMIYDAQGKKISEEKVVDLTANPLLYIKEVIPEENFL